MPAYKFYFQDFKKAEQFAETFHGLEKILLSPCGMLEVISFVIFSKKLCDSIG